MPRDPLSPYAIAADAIAAALGNQAAYILLVCLRAGWLTTREADLLEPLAVELGRMIGEEVPPHRGRAAEVTGGLDDAA